MQNNPASVWNRHLPRRRQVDMFVAETVLQIPGR